MHCGGHYGVARALKAKSSVNIILDERIMRAAGTWNGQPSAAPTSMWLLLVQFNPLKPVICTTAA